MKNRIFAGLLACAMVVALGSCSTPDDSNSVGLDKACITQIDGADVHVFDCTLPDGRAITCAQMYKAGNCWEKKQ